MDGPGLASHRPHAGDFVQLQIVHEHGLAAPQRRDKTGRGRVRAFRECRTCDPQGAAGPNGFSFAVMDDAPGRPLPARVPRGAGKKPVRSSTCVSIPDLAAEVTCNPCGGCQQVSFAVGARPQLAPTNGADGLGAIADRIDRAAPVFETIQLCEPNCHTMSHCWGFAERRGRPQSTWSPDAAPRRTALAASLHNNAAALAVVAPRPRAEIMPWPHRSRSC